MKNKLRVVFFINNLEAGGAERQLLELVKGLNKELFQATVITLYPGGALAPEFMKLKHVELISLGRRGKYDFFVVFKAAALLRRINAQVVQSFLAVASVIGLSAAFLARTPVKIGTKRTGGPKKSWSGDGLYRFIEIQLAKRCEAAVANSEAGKQFLVSEGVPPGKAKVILNGVDLARLSARSRGNHDEIRRLLKPNPGTAVVGMVANLTENKDHESLLRAAAKVRMALPDTRFAIIGDGPLRASLETLRDQLQLKDHVIFFGYRDDVTSFYNLFDLAVLSTSHPEGHSNFLLEAMMLGKPVIATDTGGTGELIQHGETGLLVPRRDPEALASAILELLNDESRAQELARRGYDEIVNKFGSERMVQEYSDLYIELYSNTGSRQTLGPKSTAPDNDGSHNGRG